MGMTAKHYDIVARSLARARQVYNEDDVHDRAARGAMRFLQHVLSEEFQNENPMFNPETFARKCRAGEGKS